MSALSSTNKARIIQEENIYYNACYARKTVTIYGKGYYTIEDKYVFT